MKKALGTLLIASPFIVVFAVAVKFGGVLAALGIFGLTGLIVGVIFLGCYLLFPDEWRG